MKKRSPLLVLSILPLLLGACSSSNPGVSASANLFFAYQHENLMQGTNYQEKEPEYYGKRDYSLKFDGLRGEYDAMQLIINAKKEISEFKIKIDADLTDGNGNTISMSQFEILVAWYVHISESNEMTKSGDYPDALIPFDSYASQERNFIDKGKNQAIYFNLNIPEDAVPGEYTSTATLTLDNEEIKIPLTAKVRKQILSKTNHRQSCFLIWYDQIGFGEKEKNTPAMRELYYNFVVSKRINPGELPSDYTSSPNVFAEAVYTKVANNEAINSLRMPVIQSSFTESRVRSYLQALVNKTKELRAAGDKTTDLFKKLYFYIDDEPGADKYDLVKYHDKFLYQVKKEMADKLEAGDVSIESLRKMKNIVTTSYKDSLVATEDEGGVQTWCPTFDNFDSKLKRDIYESRKSSNLRYGSENVWWYGCINPTLPYASYHTDAPLTGAKSIAMMQYAYGIEGEVYWNTCYYSQYTGGVSHQRDIWNDNMTWEGCNGDGFLMYPGYEYDLKTPITTLRLENILAGSEQYEFLYMLNEYVNKYNEAHQSNENLNKLLSSTYDKVFEDCCPTYDSKKSNYTQSFDEVKKILLDSLDAFNTSLDEGMNYLKGLK